MAKFYQVFGGYDRDDGYGNTLYHWDPIALFEKQEDAEDFIKKYENESFDKAVYAVYEHMDIGEKDIILHDEYPAFIKKCETDNIGWLL